jgi:single-strand DNA-binding protein
MALNVNKVILAGCLGRDPEVRYTSSGTAVANTSIAVSRRFKSGEDWKEETTWVDLEVWGARAESFAEYMHKGKPCYIEGYLKLDQWEDKNTKQKRTKLKVTVDQWQFVESKKKEENSGDSRGGNSRSRGSSQGGGSRERQQETVPDSYDDDDVPF